MKYTVIIDQIKSLEWGLNSNQAALFSVLYNISNWAKYYIIDAHNGNVYYHASRNMIINEIPLYYNKPDTVYRAMLVLWQKNLIDYQKSGNKDLVLITQKGKSWNNVGNKSENSEINPSKLGNKSEKNSEINPTDQYTNIDQYTNDQIKDIEIYENFDFFKDEFKNIWINEFLPLKQKKKASLTSRAKKSQLNKIKEYSNNDYSIALKILVKTVDSGWTDFYPLKKEDYNQNKLPTKVPTLRYPGQQ